MKNHRFASVASLSALILGCLVACGGGDVGGTSVAGDGTTDTSGTTPADGYGPDFGDLGDSQPGCADGVVLKSAHGEFYDCVSQPQETPAEPPAEAPPADEPPAEAPPVAEPPPAAETPAQDPPAAEPPAEAPPAAEPPAEEPPVTETPAQDPPAEEPPVTDPPAEEPPVQDPPGVCDNANGCDFAEVPPTCELPPEEPGICREGKFAVCHVPGHDERGWDKRFTLCLPLPAVDADPVGADHVGHGDVLGECVFE